MPAPAQDELQDALDSALRFLGSRPRSAQEIRRRLARKQIPLTTVERVIERLRSWQLVDDAAFARYWVEQRRTFNPRGARLLRAELRQRGVDAELATEAAGEAEPTADDDAYRAASRRARQLAALDERSFRVRLGQLLARRGFDWETIAPAVERLWRETHGEAGSSST